MKGKIILIFFIAFFILLAIPINATATQLLGNTATNKFYIITAQTSTKTPSSATTEYTDTQYNQTNISDANRYDFSQASTISATRYAYSRWTFNLSAIMSLGTIDWMQICLQGYWSNSQSQGDGTQTFYYYNNNTRVWVSNGTAGYNSEGWNCSNFSTPSTYITENMTFMYGEELSASPDTGASTSHSYHNFVNLTVDYVDTTPPIITVQSPVNNTFYTNNTIWFNVTLNEAGSKCLVNISNTNYTLTNSTGKWNYLSNALADGNYWTRFYCNDTAGNMNSPVYINFTIDIPPSYSLNQTNNNAAGLATNFSLAWTDNVGLNGYIFSTNNTGTWLNSSYISFSGATNTSWNITILNSTVGTVVAWCFYANDTSSNWNGTSCSNPFTFTTNNQLIGRLNTLVNSKINWSESEISAEFIGYMFGTINSTSLQSWMAGLTDSILTLKAYSEAMKYGMENQTKIEWALDNITMMSNGLPYTEANTIAVPHYGFDTFSLYNRFLVNGYYWARKYNYETDKWNITKAYNSFDWSINNSAYPGVLCVNYDNTTDMIAYGPRYYDEAGETMDMYMRFYSLGVTQALNEAERTWNWINNHLWSGSFYNYARDWPGHEVEAGNFYKIVLRLNYFDPSVSNITRLAGDADNRFLSKEWNSPQWTYESVSYYAAVHLPEGNSQRRLEGTLGSWESILGDYYNMTQAQQTNASNLISGYGNYSPAWQLLESGSGLYSPSSGMYRYYSDSTDSSPATAQAAALYMLYGIVPNDGILAMSVSENYYQDILTVTDTGILSLNLTTRVLRIPIAYSGNISFQYNSTVKQNFSQAGVYNITFAPDWNSITSINLEGVLPSNRIYFHASYSSSTYSNSSINNTLVGQPTLFSLNWDNNFGLSGYIFQFCNGTWSGSSCLGPGWANETWSSFGMITWSNVTKVVNLTAGATIAWCIYANDTSNNWNGTSCSSPFTYVTTSTALNYTQNLTQSLSVSQLTSRMGLPIESVITSLLTSSALSQTSAFYKLPSSYLNANQALSRIGALYKSLTSSFIINRSVSNLGTLYKSITFYFTIDQSVSRLSTLIRLPTSYFNISQFTSSLSSIYKSVSSSITTNAIVSRISALFRLPTSSFMIEQSYSRLYSSLISLTSSMSISQSLTRIGSLYRLITSYFTAGQAITRLSFAYRSLASSFVFNQSVSRLSTVYKSITTNFVYSQLLSRLSSAYKSVTGYFTISQSINGLPTLFKFLFQSITVNTTASRILASLRSITSYFSISQSLSRLSTLLRTPTSSLAFSNTITKSLSSFRSITSSFIINTASSRLYSSLKSITGYFTLSQSFSRLLSQTRIFSEGFNADSLIYRSLNFERMFSSSILYDSSTRLLNAYNRHLTGNFILSGSTSRIAELNTLFGESISINLISTRFMLMSRDLTTSLSVTDSLYRLITITRMLSTGFSVSDMTSRVQSITYVFSQRFSLIARALGFMPSILNQIEATLSLSFSNSVQRTTAFTRAISESLSINAVFSRALSLIRMFSEFFGIDGTTYGIRPLICSLQSTESNCAFVGGCYWCSGTCQASTCTQPSLPPSGGSGGGGGGGGGFTRPSGPSIKPEVNTVLDTSVRIETPQVSPGDKVYATVTLMKVEGPGIINVNISYWMKDRLGNIIGMKQTVVGVETIRSDIYFLTVPIDTPVGTYTFQVLAQYDNTTDTSFDNFQVTNAVPKPSLAIKRVDVPFILVNQNASIKVILENLENRKIDLNVTLLLPYDFIPQNITKLVSLEPLSEDVVEFTFVSKNAGSFTGFINVGYEDKRIIRDFGIEIYSTENFLVFLVVNYWWVIALALIALIAFFIYKTRGRFKRKKKSLYIFKRKDLLP